MINDKIKLVNICLSCKSEGKYPLCSECAQNPFFVERARQILASMNDLNFLRKTYNVGYAEIKDLNKASFWNKKLSEMPKLDKQDGMTKDRIKIAFEFLPKDAKRVLDIGAGNGFIEELLSKKPIKIYGNDISSFSIKNLKSRFKGKFKKDSIYTMRYPRGYFDTVFALEVLEHIPPSKIFEVLKKIKEYLRGNGAFIVSVPTNEGLDKMKKNPSGHLRTYTENLIRAELKLAGFRVSKSKTLYAFKSYYMIKKISSRILRNRWKPNDIVILAKKV